MAQMFIKKNVGKNSYTFVVNGENLFDLITESQKFSFPDVKECGICQSTNLILSSHVAKDRFKYATVKCLTCKGSLNFGQQQKDPSVFYLRTKDVDGKKVYDWRESGNEFSEDNQNSQQNQNGGYNQGQQGPYNQGQQGGNYNQGYNQGQHGGYNQNQQGGYNQNQQGGYQQNQQNYKRKDI